MKISLAATALLLPLLTDLSNGANTGSVGARGFEFLTLHAGGDIHLSQPVSIGPFVSFSIARFDTATLETGGTSTSMDIANTAVHEWLQIGLRGAFNL